MGQRIIVMPRWGGSETHDWYPWLKGELSGHQIDVAPLAPTPAEPEIAPSVAALAQLIGDEARDDGTLLVGHSVGCQAILRYLASVGDARPAPFGVVCVAGWFWVDEPWPSIRPWMDSPIDFAAARRATDFVRVLLSDDDPFTRDHAENAAAWADRMGAAVSLSVGSKHFNRSEEPEVLEAIRSALARR